MVVDQQRSGGWQWAYRHPVGAAVAVFAVLYLPLALIAIAGDDRDLLVLPLPGSLVLAAITFAAYRWGNRAGRGSSIDGEAVVADLPPSSDRTLAQVAQIGILFCPVVAPLAVLLSAGSRPFVRGYAAQALNLQATLAVAMTALAAVVVSSSDGPLLAVVYVVALVVYVYTLAVSVIGTSKAAHGFSWRYPANVSVVH